MESTKTMQAVKLLGDRRISYETVDIPRPKSHEVLIQVKAVGICATDLEIYDGSMIYFQTGMATFPIIPGHEWSGEIVEVGQDVTGLAVGDRVVGETTISCGHCEYCQKGHYNLCPQRLENGVLGKNGACAEFMTYPALAVHRIGPTISFEEAALIETSSVAYRGVEKLNITPHDNVLIIGAGPVGLLAMQMSKACGAQKVTLVDFQEKRLELGARLGADETINLSQLESNQPREAFTAIVEATGNPAAVESIFSYAVPAARVCLMGLCGGRHAHIPVDKLVTYDLEIHGSLGSPGVWNTVIKLLEAGKLNTKELITHRFRMEEMERAFTLMEKKDPSVIKILLINEGGESLV